MLVEDHLSLSTVLKISIFVNEKYKCLYVHVKVFYIYNYLFKVLFI